MRGLVHALISVCPPWLTMFLAKLNYRVRGLLARFLSPVLPVKSARWRLEDCRATEQDAVVAKTQGWCALERRAVIIKEYRDCEKTALELDPVPMSWVASPSEGNVGDWLGPYLFKKVASRPVEFMHIRNTRRRRHVLSVGSILASATAASTVIGSGFNAAAAPVNPKARYVSVRGRLSEQKVVAAGVHCDFQPCDPGFFISNVDMPTYAGNKDGVAFAPHVNHVAGIRGKNLDMELIYPYARSIEEIERLVFSLHKYNKIITSAMHIFIICCSFGIPVALVDPIDIKGFVPGDGFKYLDMSSILTDEITPQRIYFSNISTVKFFHFSQFSYVNERYAEYRDFVHYL